MPSRKDRETLRRGRRRGEEGFCAAVALKGRLSDCETIETMPRAIVNNKSVL